MRAVIVQQGAWPAPLPTMPLAAGYLKAAAAQDPDLRDAVTVDIVNLPGGTGPREGTIAVLGGDAPAPDVLAFSVLGWNQRTFGELARTYKQVRPDGLVVFGGNHVTNQAEATFARFPEVDVVVNGEGERTFVELLRWRLGMLDAPTLGAIRGVSFRDGDRVVTTEARERCSDLDELASPILSGAIPLVDDDGRFPYDVALLETNRGCPYRCSFCYWGGAIGARVHEFSRDRLRAELDLLGAHGVESVVLCDANFGMRRADLAFVEDLLATRARHGFPRYLESSWTKNKSEVFYEIVHRMKAEGLASSFTLALQSLDEPTLAGMARRNMQINEWKDLARFLHAEGFDCYGELIWGAPGETPESFFAGYDELARVVPRIAVYPLLVIPNTTYAERRDELGLVTVRGDDDDFEYVLAHETMTVEENLDVQRVVFWARVLAENGFLRWCWPALAHVPAVSQSAAIRAFADRLAASGSPLAVRVAAMVRPFADSRTVGAVVRELHRDLDEARRLVDAWWEHDVVAVADPTVQPFLRSVLAYDWLTLPVYVEPGDRDPLPIEDLDGERHYVRPSFELDHDVPAALATVHDPSDGTPAVPPVHRHRVQVVAKVGFHDVVENHELGAHHVGRPRP